VLLVQECLLGAVLREKPFEVSDIKHAEREDILTDHSSSLVLCSIPTSF
jgi:hypothetical protein